MKLALFAACLLFCAEGSVRSTLKAIGKQAKSAKDKADDAKAKADDVEDKLETANATLHCLLSSGLLDNEEDEQAFTLCGIFTALDRGWDDGCDTVFAKLDEMGQGLACVEALTCRGEARLPDRFHGECLPRCETVELEDNASGGCSGEEGSVCQVFDGYYVECNDSYLVTVGYKAVCNMDEMTIDLRYGFAEVPWDAFTIFGVFIMSLIPPFLAGSEKLQKNELTAEGTLNTILQAICVVRAWLVLPRQGFEIGSACSFVVFGSSFAFMPLAVSFNAMFLSLANVFPNEIGTCGTMLEKYVYGGVHLCGWALYGVGVLVMGLPLGCFLFTALWGALATPHIFFINMIPFMLFTLLGKALAKYYKKIGKENPELEKTAGLGGSVFMLLCFLGSLVPAWGLYKGVGWVTINEVYFERLLDFNLAFPNMQVVMDPERLLNAFKGLLSINLDLPSFEIASLSVVISGVFIVCKTIRKCIYCCLGTVPCAAAGADA